MMKQLKIFILFSILLGLASCSESVKKSLNLEKSAPDTFKVVTNPPLSVPPSFKLKAPIAGEDDQNIPEDELEELSDLMALINPKDEEEAELETAKEGGIFDKAIEFLKGEDEEEEILNAKEEYNRILESTKQGKPIHIEKISEDHDDDHDDDGILEHIFGD